MPFKDPEVRRARNRVYDRIYREKNPDKMLEKGRRRRAKKAAELDAYLSQWWADRPGRRKEYNHSYRTANLGKFSASESARRAAIKQALASWANLDAIEAIYVECARVTAETGIPHHVDHIIPLKGKTVCGLHVEYNLRIITKDENQRKKAKLIPELIPNGSV